MSPILSSSRPGDVTASARATNAGDVSKGYSTSQLLLQTIGGSNPMGGNELQFPTTFFNMAGISTAGQFASDVASLNIFQFSSYINNTGTGPAVAAYMQGVGGHVWGFNAVAYAKGSSTAAALGGEIDFGNYNTTTTTVSGSQVLPITTLNVASTAGASAAGNVVVGAAVFAYTGTTPTSFTGLTALNAAALSGTLNDGSTATYSTPTAGVTTGLALFAEGGRAGGEPANAFVQFSSGGAGDQAMYGLRFSGSGTAGGQQPLRAEGAGIQFQVINTAQGIAFNQGTYTAGILFSATTATYAMQVQSGTYTDGIRIASASAINGINLTGNTLTGAGVSIGGSATQGLLLSSLTATHGIQFSAGTYTGDLFRLGGSAVNGINFSSTTLSGNAIIFGEGHNVQTGTTTGTKIGTNSTQKLGFWGATPVAKPAAITGSRGANAALASLLTALASTGLITDSTT